MLTKIFVLNNFTIFDLLKVRLLIKHISKTNNLLIK